MRLPVTRARKFGIEMPNSPDVFGFNAHASAPTK